MRNMLAATFLLPAVVGLLYACSGDDPAPASVTADAGPTATPPAPPPPPATPPAPPPPPPTDSGADAPPPYTPATLGSKLVLWLDADNGYAAADGGTVWHDRSTFANDAKQNDNAHTPARIDGGADGGLANNGVVHFSGVEWLEIADNASLRWGSSDFGLYTVMRHTNDPSVSYAIVYGKWTDVYPEYPGLFLWANYPAGIKDGYVARLDVNNLLHTDGGMNDDSIRLIGIRRTGNHFEVRVNGQPAGDLADAGSVDASAFDGVGQNALIGGRPALIQMLKGDVAEMVGLKGTVTDTEQTDLEGYLKTRYGL